MSTLLLDDLPLSEQVAIGLAWASQVEAKTRALFAAFEPPVDMPVTPSCSGALLPAGGSNLSPTAEHAAMMESQCTDHPPLQVCHPGHRPMMFKASGNLKTVFYVSCGPCGVRTARWPTTEAAANAWAQRDVMPVMAVA